MSGRAFVGRRAVRRPGREPPRGPRRRDGHRAALPRAGLAAGGTRVRLREELPASDPHLTAPIDRRELERPVKPVGGCRDPSDRRHGDERRRRDQDGVPRGDRGPGRHAHRRRRLAGGSRGSATSGRSTPRSGTTSRCGTSRRSTSGTSAGPTRCEAAQRVFSNDALGLEVGQARYGAFLDDDGLMVDDGTVFNTGGRPLLGDDERQGPRRLLRRGAEGLRRRVRVDRAADAAPRRDRSALARGRAEAHRRRRGRAPVLPVPPRARQGGRGRGVPVADRLRRRARVRAVPDRSVRCGGPLERGRGRGRDAVRRRGDRARYGSRPG